MVKVGPDGILAERERRSKIESVRAFQLSQTSVDVSHLVYDCSLPTMPGIIQYVQPDIYLLLQGPDDHACR